MAFGEIFNILHTVNERLSRPPERKSVLSSYFDGHLEFQDPYVDPSPSPEPSGTPSEDAYVKEKLDVSVGRDLRYGTSRSRTPRKRKRAPDSCEPTFDSNSNSSYMDLKIRRKKRKGELFMVPVKRRGRMCAYLFGVPTPDITDADAVCARHKVSRRRHENPRPKIVVNNGPKGSKAGGPVLIGGYFLRRTSARARDFSRRHKPAR